MSATLRVAVADDDSTNRAAVIEMLEGLGHDVVSEAASGEELIEQVAEQKPDVVLTDLQMVGANGENAAAEIAETDKTPVVMMTSSHEPAQVRKALGPSNVVGYLAKPFGSATLDGAIRFAIGLFNRFRDIELRLDTLRRSQGDRQVIERAKEILMKQLQLNEADAHRKLQKMASSKNIKLVDLARKIVESPEGERLA